MLTIVRIIIKIRIEKHIMTYNELALENRTQISVILVTDSYPFAECA